MEAGRAVMSSGSRAKARSEIPFAGKYNNACRATWLLLGRRWGGWWFGGGCETCTDARRHYFFMDTGVRTKLHPCRFRKMA